LSQTNHDVRCILTHDPFAPKLSPNRSKIYKIFNQDLNLSANSFYEGVYILLNDV